MDDIPPSEIKENQVGNNQQWTQSTQITEIL